MLRVLLLFHLPVFNASFTNHTFRTFCGVASQIEFCYAITSQTSPQFQLHRISIPLISATVGTAGYFDFWRPHNATWLF